MRVDGINANLFPCEIEQYYGTFEVTNCFHRDGACNNVSQLLTSDCPSTEPMASVANIPGGFSISWKQYNYETMKVQIQLEMYRHSFVPLVLFSNGYMFRTEADYVSIVAAFTNIKWDEVKLNTEIYYKEVSEYGIDYKAEIENEKGENSLSDGDLILLAYEDDAKNNGIYSYDSTCGVTRCDRNIN